MRNRGVVVACAVVLCSAVLAGCEQPPPGITVFSGTQSQRVAAMCWAFDAPSVTSGECAQSIVAGTQLGDAPRLPVMAGNVLGISVDQAVAESGWVPAIAGQRLVNRPITETYYRFTFPPGELPRDGVGLQVLAGTGSSLRGVWAVRLVS